MPIAIPDHYVAMLDRAKAGRFAYPAINVTGSQTVNAALQGFAEADSDGIIQVSLGMAQQGLWRPRRCWDRPDGQCARGSGGRRDRASSVARPVQSSRPYSSTGKSERPRPARAAPRRLAASVGSKTADFDGASIVAAVGSSGLSSWILESTGHTRTTRPRANAARVPVDN